MNKNTAIALLLIVAVVWGGGFVGAKIALDAGISVGLLNMLRGSIFATCVFVFFSKHILSMDKQTFKRGALVGCFNFLGFIFQTLGAELSIPSNTAFLTTTNVAMVPFIVWAMYKVKPHLKSFVSVGLCIFGMMILTGVLSDGITLSVGNFYTLCGAFFFAFSIVLLSKQSDNSHFSVSAFMMGLMLCIGSSGYFVVIEKAVVPSVDWATAVPAILYLSICSNFIGQTLQVMVQKHIPATTACLIMLLEAVFGSIFSIIWGFENFTTILLIGGALILFSVIMSEVDLKSMLTKKNIQKSQK